MTHEGMRIPWRIRMRQACGHGAWDIDIGHGGETERRNESYMMMMASRGVVARRLVVPSWSQSFTRGRSSARLTPQLGCVFC